MADERVIVKILSVVVAFKMSMVIMIVGGIKAPKVCNSGILLWPMIAIGLFLVVTCMFGCCGVSEDGIFICFLAGVLIAMLSLVVFVLFAFIAVGGIDAGQVKLQEYKLEDYRGWLRGRVADPHYWATTVACLRRRDVCELSSDPNLAEKYNNDNYVISPIEVAYFRL
uniref:Uncharacterized protein n=1 Tax=Oryza brachyantha TaxID=4533 RepID=J3LUV3_ORYBR